VDKQGFEAEAERLIGAARERGVTLRLLGALAFAHHCQRFGHLQQAMGRHYTDIDLAGYGRQGRDIQRLMADLGYGEDRGVYVESEGSRLVFAHPGSGLHVDVFLDKLEFCHTISWKGRLERDDPTIPLAELLLEKMQIVQINEKDIIDTIMLLLENDLGESDREEVNIGLVARTCAGDWSWWRTLTMNLRKVE